MVVGVRVHPIREQVAVGVPGVVDPIHGEQEVGFIVGVGVGSGQGLLGKVVAHCVV